MFNFQNIPIRRKLTLISMLTVCVALLLTCGVIVGYEMVSFRRTLSETVLTTAEMVGDNSAAALTFEDSASAEQTLRSVSADDHIVAAIIYDVNGQPFAHYQPPGASRLTPPPVEQNLQRFTDDHLEVFRDISVAGEKIGTIYLRHDMLELRQNLQRSGLLVLGVLVTASLVALLLTHKLQPLITGPIMDLAKVVRQVAIHKNFSVRAVKRGEDEVGRLIDGFNVMLSEVQLRDSALETARADLELRVEERTSELERTHKQLLEASRLGGMAEIATNVLHNVGNVLNSVNVSTDVIAESMKKSGAANLAKVVALLKEHPHDLGDFISNDPRGKHVLAHLAQLSEHLMSRQKAMIGELDSLRGNVEHIKEIVAMQQDYATFGGVRETIDVVALVEDSLRMNEGSMSRHQLEVIREFDAVPLMNVEKHKILQILVNLLRNAKHACDDSDRTDKRLTVRVAGEDGRVIISVMDNGVGIPSENLTRIFNHGFTTRKSGHGFGLHSGALAAREMGGSLTVQSDGPGLGATFTLELPCQTQENSYE